MKLDRISLIVAGLLILAGCSRPLEKRIDGFVSKTETRYENYTEEDWQKSLEEYEALVQEYKDNYKSFSKEGKHPINHVY